MKVILHLTQNCNLQCKYCYAATGPQKQMELEVAKGAINFVVDKSDESACVSYFGGEPLLMWDKLKILTPYAKKQATAKGLDMHFRMSTNGLLFNEEILSFCREYNILFAVSMDGNEESHNSSRILPDGSGSFSILRSKIELILKYNPLAVFSFVITPDNLPYLYDSVEYMWSLGIRYVAHSPDFTHPKWNRQNFELLQEQFNKLSEWYIEKTRSGTYFYMNLFDDKIKTHAKTPVMPGEVCDFGARKFSVAHDGTIYPCVRFVSDNPDSNNYIIGNVFTGFNSNRNKLITQNRLPRPQCEGCDFIGRCSNYCGCTNWTTTGSILTVSPFLCEFEQMLIPISDNIGNILWNERNPSFLAKHYKISSKYFPLLTSYDID